MEVKPGYKQTEVGVIPEEWEALRMGSLGIFGKGQGIRKDEAASGDLPCIRYGEIYTHHNDIIWVFNSRISPGVAATSRRLTKGDLLFAGSGETKEEIGKCVAFVGDEHAYAGGDIVILTPNKGDSRYLGYLFNAPVVARQKASKGQGDAVVHISAAALSAIKIPFPPLPEQRAIATALSDVDGLLGGLNRLIAKKRDLKQAVMQQLLTGQTRLPGFHGDWEVKRLGEICEIAMGRTPPRLNQAYWGHGYKWLSIADLQTKVVSDSKEEITELAASMMTIIPKGTLLMSFKLSLGRMCFAGCDLFTNEAICSFNRLQANAEFLYYVLGRTDFSLYGKQAVKGYTLNKESLKSIKVTLPALLEQTAIAEVLTEMDGELAALEQRREKTRVLKQAMMQELLTGRTRLV